MESFNQAFKFVLDTVNDERYTPLMPTNDQELVNIIMLSFFAPDKYQDAELNAVLDTHQELKQEIYDYLHGENPLQTSFIWRRKV